MKKVYLAGAMTNRPDNDLFDWRDVATRLLAEQGFDVIDPTKHHCEPGDQMTRDRDAMRDAHAIVDQDLASVRSCDAVLANVTWPSWGTAMEVLTAHYNNKPVIAFQVLDQSYGYPHPLSPYVIAFTKERCTNVAEAVAVLVNFFK